MPADPEKGVAFLERLLERAAEGRRELDREYRARLREFDSSIDRLERALSELRRLRRLERRKSGRRGPALDPHVQAGVNKPKMLAVFERLGTATQAEASRAAGVVSGSSTWAIKALLEDGLIEPTGRTERRSVEYRFIGHGRPLRRKVAAPQASKAAERGDRA